MRLAIAVVLMLPSVPAYAQDADEPMTRLLGAHSIRCEFGRGTQASWNGGALKLENSNFGEGGEVTFDSIDPNARKARIIANAGAGDVLLLVTAAGLTFVEQTPAGNLNFTTVFAAYDSTASRRFVAVSSRHQNLFGPFPSQYHGACFVLE